MTIGTNNRNDAVGNGANKVYPYQFKIFAETDLEVTVRLIATGAETTLVFPTHYNVSGVGLSAGGNVTLVGTTNPWQDSDGDLLSTYSITIRRVRPLTQLADLRNAGGFFAESHEDAFDHLMMVLQQLNDEIDRSIHLSASYSPASYDLTLPPPLAGMAIGWNNAANGLVNLLNAGASVSTYIQTLLDDANDSIARATLGAARIVDAKLTLIDTKTANNSATLDFTTGIDGTYDEYLFEIIGLIPVASLTELRALMSVNGGSSYDSSAVYSRAVSTLSAAAVPVLAHSGVNGSGTWIALSGSLVANSAAVGINGSAKLFAPANAVRHKYMRAFCDYFDGDTNVYQRADCLGVYGVTTAINAIRFAMSSGNISSGTIRLYGIGK